MTLDQVPVGQLVHITALQGEADPVLLRLMEMGLVTGAPLLVRKRAPFGGPMELRVEGYLLSIRASEARRIDVRAPQAKRQPAKAA